MDAASLDPRLRDAAAAEKNKTNTATEVASSPATANKGSGSALLPSTPVTAKPATSPQQHQRDAVQTQSQPQEQAPSYADQQQQQHSQIIHKELQPRSQDQFAAHNHGQRREQGHGNSHTSLPPLQPPHTSVSTTAGAGFSPETGDSASPSTPDADANGSSSYQHAHGGGGGGADLTPGGVDGTPGDPNYDPKKPRACESCRGLKVRCEPELSNPDGPCKRCTKAKRPCVVTQPTRKRQKKTDNRVAELEKKIDALTASLQAKAGGGPGMTTSASPTVASLSHPAVMAGSGGSGEVRGSAHNNHGSPATLGKDWMTMQARERPAPTTQPAQRSSAYGNTDMGTTGQKRKFNETTGEDVRDPSAPRPRTDIAVAPENPDIVDRGIITMVQACELFARYTEQMAPHLPGVVFPANMTAAELRRSKPILFLSVMAAASSNTPPLQRILTNELMRLFAEKVIVSGEKSLELVQALQLSVIWYYPPENFEEFKFYQLLHIAAVMAIDLGLGRKKQAKGGFRKHLPNYWRDHSLRKRVVLDPTTLEARRAWLTCYFLATNSSMALHRPNLIRWTSFMAECVDILESSPEAASTDKYFCHLVWTHRLAEEVGITFSMDDPISAPNITQASTQYALKGFELQLERHRSAMPEDMQQASLKLSFHVLNLYMHEIATQSDSSDEFRPLTENLRESLSNNLTGDDALTPAHINALSACLTAIDGIFDVFLSLDVVSIRCLPVFNFVRVAYAVVVLMKIYFAASSPKSELGKVINKDNMKVEQHLENLLEKFAATAADDRSRPAAKFLVVLIMLRSWFQKQNQMGGPAAVADAVEPSQVQNTGGGEKGGSYAQQQNKPTTTTPGAMDYASTTTTTTPLELLSEVATNNSSSTPGSSVNNGNNAAAHHRS
ncbi:hypothetical protein B0H66DRAFT_469156, partial [Apodospora peruviana]